MWGQMTLQKTTTTVLLCGLWSQKRKANKYSINELLTMKTMLMGDLVSGSITPLILTMESWYKGSYISQGLIKYNFKLNLFELK